MGYFPLQGDIKVISRGVNWKASLSNVVIALIRQNSKGLRGGASGYSREGCCWDGEADGYVGAGPNSQGNVVLQSRQHRVVERLVLN